MLCNGTTGCAVVIPFVSFYKNRGSISALLFSFLEKDLRQFKFQVFFSFIFKHSRTHICRTMKYEGSFLFPSKCLLCSFRCCSGCRGVTFIERRQKKKMFSQTTATTGSLTADCSAYHRAARNRFTTHFMAVTICSIQTTR